MITTVTPNPCIDKTLTVERFDIYDMNRVTVLRSDPGGKGINVSRALKRLGCETQCCGFNFLSGGKIVTDTLAAEGIGCRFVDLDAELRVCTKLFDKSISHTIEINEKGKPVSEEDGKRLLDTVAEAAKESSFITLSGSLPAGLPEDFYGKCASVIKKSAPGCRIVVDAEKKTLRYALEYSPFFIKPNIYEFQNTFGCVCDTTEKLDAEVQKVISEYSLGLVCVSMGSRGAYMSDGKSAFLCPPAKVEVRSIQGAGDSMIAGILCGLEKGLPLDKVLRYGICAAAESISLEGTQFCSKEGTEALLGRKSEVVRLR